MDADDASVLISKPNYNEFKNALIWLLHILLIVFMQISLF
jgi:hypothetical protein